MLLLGAGIVTRLRAGWFRVRISSGARDFFSPKLSDWPTHPSV